MNLVLADRFRTDPRRVTKAIAHPQFLEYSPQLKAFMRRSREADGQPEQVLYLQAQMANALLGAEESQRGLKKDAKGAAGGDASHLTEIEAVIGVANRIAYVIRQIADGIAWRSLGYDRVMLHQLSLKPHTGHVELDVLLSEFTVAAEHLAGSGELVIINDITNFLRYGDLTSVGKKGITIHEVKAGRGAARSGHALKQRQRTMGVLEFLKSRERRSGENVERLVRFRAAPRGHAHELASLIREARREGSAHARLSDCLAAEVFDTELMAEAVHEGTASTKKCFHNPFAQSSDGGVHHSLQFDRFTPNLAPYSVFPLPADDCADIMTGALWVFTYFNLGNLRRCLRRRGLFMRIPTEAELAGAPRDLKPGQVRQHELDNPLLVTRGPPGPVLAVSFAALGRMMHEFLDEESFADMMEESLDSADPNAETIEFSAFEDEASLWD